MARTLETEQNALVSSAGLRIATLVKITTYTDRASNTGAFVFWLSDKPVIYDYDNAGTDRDFWPVVAAPGSLQQQFVHTPSPRDLAPYEGGVTLTMSNQEFHGRRLYTLMTDKNILGADIEIAQMAQSSNLTYPVDLTSSTGTEHTVFFRGVVTSIGNVGNTDFVLECAVRTPPMSQVWAYATATSVAPSDRGRRLPVVYGQAKRVPAIGYRVPGVTSILEAVSAEDEDIDVEATDLSHFLPWDGTNVRAWLGSEYVLISRTVSNYITKFVLTDRGQATMEGVQTIAQNHGVGAALVEVFDATFDETVDYLAAEYPVSAILDVYAENYATGELFRVHPDSYTANTEDRLLVPGKVVASVRVDQAQFDVLRSDLASASASLAYQEPSAPVANYQLILNEGTTTGEAVRVAGPASDNCWGIAGTSSIAGDMQNGSGAGGTLDDIVVLWSLDGTAGAPNDDRKIRRVRAVIRLDTFDTTNFFDTHFSGKVFDRKLKWNGDDSLKKRTNAMSGVASQLVVSDWLDVSGNIYQIQDLERSASTPSVGSINYVSIVLDSNFNDDEICTRIYEDTSYWELDADPSGSLSPAVLSGGAKIPQLWADVDGIKAPGDDIDPTATPTLVDDMDSSDAAWAETSCTDTDSAEQIFEGAGSLKIVSDASTTWHIQRTNFSSEDWTDQAFVFRIYMEAAMLQALLDADTVTAFEVLISRTTDFSNNFKAFEVPLHKIIPDRWVELHVTLNDAENSETGTLDTTDVNAIRFSWVQDAATANRNCYIDFLERVDSERLYTVAHRALIEKNVDVLTHWVQEIGGETIHRAARTAANTSMGSNVLAGYVNALGFTWGEVAQQLSYQSRANLIPEQTADGREWKILAADANYLFPAPSLHITEFDASRFRDSRRNLEDLGTRFNYRYQYRSGLGVGEEGYTKVIEANYSSSDVDVTPAQIQTAVSAIGELENPPGFFRTIDDEDTGKDVAGYLVQEAIAHGRSVFEIPGIPWTQSYKIELGDIIEVTQPWMDHLSDTVVFSLDSDAANWTGQGGATLADNNVLFYEGTGSIKVTPDGVTVFSGMRRDSTRRYNLRDKALSIAIRPKDGATLANLTNMRVTIGSLAGLGTDWAQYEVPTSTLVAGEFTPVRIPIENPLSTAGTYEPQRTIAWQVEWTQDSLQAAWWIFFDLIKIVPKTVPCRVISISKNFTNEHTDIVAVEVVTV